MSTRERPRRGPALRGDTRGFIVLAPLIVLVVVVVALTLLGKVVRYQYPERYPARFEERELRFAVVPVELRDGGRVTARLAPADSAWVYRLENGEVVVFAGPRGDRVLGLTRGSAFSPVRPARR